jgi:polyketide cyclase/dehydrase/lipid transport protein
MAAVVESIEISRRPEDVFRYVAGFSHFPEWQGGTVSRPQSGNPLAAGATAVVIRRAGRRALARTEEITEWNPPRTWAVRGVGGGLVLAIAKGVIEPLDGGERSRVTIGLDFEVHGIGRLLVPLVMRRQARRQLPRNEQRLKEILERGA